MRDKATAEGYFLTPGTLLRAAHARGPLGRGRGPPVGLPTVIVAVLSLLVVGALAVLVGGYLFSWPPVRLFDPLYEPLSRQAPRTLSSRRLQHRVLKLALDRISVGINGGVMMPTTYEVRLAPEDIEVLGGLEDWFAGELAGAVADKARQRGAPVARPPSVAIVADDSRPLSRPVVDARFEQPTRMATGAAGAGAPGPGGPAAGWQAGEATAVESRTVAQATWLLLPAGPDAPLDGAGAIRLAGAQMVVGRSRSADVTLDDATISSRHVRLDALPTGGWGVTDLGSTNGTRLNGTRLTAPAVLSPGDELGIGGLLWRVEQR